MQNVITTLSNAIWEYFGHHQIPQQQHVNVTPVIKGTNSALQISQNQYDDYQEDICTLKQAYQSIAAIRDPIEIPTRISRLASRKSVYANGLIVRL